MVAKAGMWSIVASLVEKLLMLGTYIIISREVDKAELGNLIIVMLVIELLNYISSFGVGENIVRRSELTNRFMASAHRFVAFFSVILFFFMLILVAPIAYFTSGSSLALLFLIMALHPTLTGFSNLYVAILQRDLRFKEIALRSAIVSSFSGAVGVVLALSGAGVFSLVIARYVNGFANIIVLRAITKFRLVSEPCSDDLKEILSFGWKLSISQLLNFSNNRIYEILVTTIFGPVYIAILDIGRKLLTTIYQVILTPLNRVSLPFMSRSEDPYTSYFKFVRYVGYLIVPLVAVLGGLSEPVIIFFFGNSWSESISILSLLSFGVVAQSATWFLSSLLIRLGRTDVVLNLQLINLVVLIISGFTGWFLSLDFYSFIKILLLGLFVSSLIRIIYVSFFAGVPFIEYLKIYIEFSALYLFFMYIIGVSETFFPEMKFISDFELLLSFFRLCVVSGVVLFPYYLIYFAVIKFQRNVNH